MQAIALQANAGVCNPVASAGLGGKLCYTVAMSFFAQIPKPPRNPPREPLPGTNGNGKQEPDPPPRIPPSDVPPKPPFDLPPEPPPAP